MADDPFEPLDPKDETIAWVTVYSTGSNWPEPSMVQLMSNERRARNLAEFNFRKKLLANPHLYDLYLKEVDDDVERGAEYGSARFYTHLLRWKRRRTLYRMKGATALNPETLLPLALIDQHDAYMARLIEEKRSDLRGHFRKAEIGKRRRNGGGPVYTGAEEEDE